MTLGLQLGDRVVSSFVPVGGRTTGYYSELKGPGIIIEVFDYCYRVKLDIEHEHTFHHSWIKPSTEPLPEQWVIVDVESGADDMWPPFKSYAAVILYLSDEALDRSRYLAAKLEQS